MRRFNYCDENAILNGLATDAYFLRTFEVLKAKNIDKRVVMEAMVKSFPDKNYNFGIFSGIQEVINLLSYVAENVAESNSLNVWAMQDGEVFFPHEPVLRIEGRYTDFGIYETAILGFLSYASGIATKAVRSRIVAKDTLVFSFGTRRLHPSVAPVIERACYTGGFDSVSSIVGAEFMGKKAVGTMPHALMLLFGNSADAFHAFDEVLPKEVPRIALIDTFGSPKEETLLALECMGPNLYGVRVDSGDLLKVGKELRWELNIRGRQDVKLFASGGLDEYMVQKLVDVYDGFGIGTQVANAPVMDFALKIVEVDGKPMAKVGNYSGAKDVYRLKNEFRDLVVPKGKDIADGYEPLLHQVMKDGKVMKSYESVDESRERVLSRIKRLPDELKSLYRTDGERVKFFS
ncbi:MAG: nicotinate phosphoribosyltransferase [Candidatus Lokiarchaeota archaeon]|nr:nicotinate phosphoribosyltransferase [Candidatus Lokiarchaeota archaeon]